MKQVILGLCFISFFFGSYSQNAKYFEKDPPGMKFIPQGSFEMKDPVSGVVKKVSVDAFWMSNEITNAEYREFVEYAKQHPDEVLERIDLSAMAKDKSEGKNVQVNDYIRLEKYSQILPGIIDTLHLPYPDYFSNKKYNKFPVVGVSHANAVNYCMWKTARINQKLKAEKKPLMQDFRVPLEAEWEYAATMGKIDDPGENHKGIQPSKSGKPNKWGLYNFEGNVSEWTTSIPKANNLMTVRGGTWKDAASAGMREEKDKNSGYGYVGFRMVCSSLAGRHLISKN